VQESYGAEGLHTEDAPANRQKKTPTLIWLGSRDGVNSKRGLIMTDAHEKSIPAVFEFHGASVRTLMVDGEPWFVAKDVAEVLGYANSSRSIQDHCKAAQILKSTDSVVLEIPPRGLQIIPERDVYRLVMRSKLPAAEQFEEWVVSEVLPQIRKTGSYGVAAPTWIQNLSPQAKVALEDLNNQVEALQFETGRLQGVCNDLAANLAHGVTPTAFCRQLNGVNTREVQKTLVERKLLIETKHGYRAAGAYRDKYFTERRGTSKDGYAFEEVVLTLKGAKRLYKMYEKGELIMKKDWDGEYRHTLANAEVAA
jgi:prophage antirepressor-like protein